MLVGDSEKVIYFLLLNGCIIIAVYVLLWGVGY